MFRKRPLIAPKKNAARHGAGVNWQVADILLEELSPAVFDIVVSNPPYVREGEKTEDAEKMCSTMSRI